MPQVWKTEVCKGIDAGAIARALESRGLLKPGNDGKLVSTHKPAGQKSLRLYHLTASIIESADNG